MNPETKPEIIIALSPSPSDSSGGSEYQPPTPELTPRKKRDHASMKSEVDGDEDELNDKSWYNDVVDEDLDNIAKKPRKSGSLSSKGGKKGRPTGVGKNGDGNRKMGSWTKKEVRQLWDAMGFLPVKVRWEEVASKVDGRDKLSCSNKWRYDMLPKIQAFIDSLGE